MIKHPSTCSQNCVGVDVFLALIIADAKNAVTFPMPVVVIADFLLSIMLFYLGIVFMLTLKMLVQLTLQNKSVTLFGEIGHSYLLKIVAWKHI